MELFFRKSGVGPPLIILHGLFGMSDNWMNIGKALARDFTVYLADLRNHGQSPHSDIFNYVGMCEDLLELMLAEKITSATIMGHSMGGKLAMSYADNYRDRVSKLIIVDIAPKSYPVHYGDILNILLSINMSVIKTRKEVEKNLLPYIEDIGLRQLLLKNIYWKEDGSLGWRMNLQALNKNINIVGEGIHIKNPIYLPVLFIRGEKSNYILNEDINSIKTFFPNASFATIANAGHWVHSENPIAFLNKVKEFLI